MPNAGPQGHHRKTLAVKHHDGEPLTRVDLQYDFLYCLLSNTQAVFTDPYTTIYGAPFGTKVTFRDLYINALVHSTKCSKVTKDKLVDTPLFGEEFAKISLLSNVGRINTTMAFFPEMRTTLRTYHPVPALQKSDGNLQDAPRIKNILKSCLLTSERQNPPSTPTDVLARSRSGEVPPTTIVNMMFVFASHSAIIAQTHFGAQTTHDFLDFFCPINISSESRARAFLWLCYHYLEPPCPNPFDDDYSRAHPGKVPRLTILSDEEALVENIDSQEEKDWGEKMLLQRREFVANKDKEEAEKTQDGIDKLPEKVKGKRRNRGKKSESKEGAVKANKKAKETSPNLGETLLPFIIKDENPLAGSSKHSSFCINSPDSPSTPSFTLPAILSPHSGRESHRRHNREHFLRSPPLHPSSYVRSSADPYPRRPPSPRSVSVMQSSHGRPSRTRARRSRELRVLSPPFQYPSHDYTPRELTPRDITPREYASREYRRRELDSREYASRGYPSDYPLRPECMVHGEQPPCTRRTMRDMDSRSYSASVPRRSPLEQAYNVVMTTDPLQESEDEETADENTRLDLLLRLRIINRLRGKEPTPELEHVPMDPMPFILPRRNS